MKKILPDKFKKYFWDYDFQTLDLTIYVEFVAERLMEKGNWECAQWLIENIPSDILLKISIRSKNISKPVANFWQLLLN
jgi:hypothetical protein